MEQERYCTIDEKADSRRWQYSRICMKSRDFRDVSLIERVIAAADHLHWFWYPEVRMQMKMSRNRTVGWMSCAQASLPLEPVAVDKPLDTNASGSGVAFNGIRLDAPAPVSDILGNYTLAPFDDCGGHINLHVGYHYHAATDCLEDTANQTDHGSVVGVAMDGYLIHARLLSDGSLPADLDQCGGHATEQLAYHYHAGEQGSNAILSCLKAEYGCVSEEPGTNCDASVSRRPGGGGGGGARPDFAAAAEKLGVSEDELMRALGAPPPDFEKAADALGVTIDALQKAMGRP